MVSTSLILSQIYPTCWTHLRISSILSLKILRGDWIQCIKLRTKNLVRKTKRTSVFLYSRPRQVCTIPLASDSYCEESFVQWWWNVCLCTWARICVREGGCCVEIWRKATLLPDSDKSTSTSSRQFGLAAVNVSQKYCICGMKEGGWKLCLVKHAPLN